MGGVEVMHVDMVLLFRILPLMQFLVLVCC